jgi:hypothetical protein
VINQQYGGEPCGRAAELESAAWQAGQLAGALGWENDPGDAEAVLRGTMLEERVAELRAALADMRTQRDSWQ